MPDAPQTRLDLVDDAPPAARERRRRWAAALLGLVTAVNLSVIGWRHLDGGARQGVPPPRPAPDRVGAVAMGGRPEAPGETGAAPGQARGEVDRSDGAATGAATALAGPLRGERAPELAAGLSEQVISHRVVAGRLKGRETVAAALSRAGVTPEQTFAIVHALKGVFDFRNARPGDAWRVKLDPDGRLLFFEYERSLLESYCVTRDGEDLVGYRKEIPVSHDVVLVRGKVHSSLYESMIRAGERPGLALMLADVLAWDIDFYRDPRPGDTFKIIVEKETYKGHTLRYGKILAAEYRGAVGRYRVFRYPSPTGGEAFYDENGHSAQKALLKAPVKLVRVTSTYGRRHHPILGYTKMHLGVDYGAPIGTPVWAVGDGTVIWAGRKGPNGNLIGLRHSNGYTTWYAHLSRIKVRRGQRVHQKDIIGLVGSTGRSTGPHLHYGVKKDGRFVNPLTLKLPPRRPLPARMLPEFKKHIEPLLRWLETPGQVAMLRAPLGDARR